MDEMNLKEAIEAIENILYSDLNLSEGTKQAYKFAISRLQLLEQVEKSGMKKREQPPTILITDQHLPHRIIGFNSAIDLCNAEWAKRLEGIEEVILDVLYNRTPVGIKIHELRPEEIAEKLSQSLTTHLTKNGETSY